MVAMGGYRKFAQGLKAAPAKKALPQTLPKTLMDLINNPTGGGVSIGGGPKTPRKPPVRMPTDRPSIGTTGGTTGGTVKVGPRAPVSALPAPYIPPGVATWASNNPAARTAASLTAAGGPVITIDPQTPENVLVAQATPILPPSGPYANLPPGTPLPTQGAALPTGDGFLPTFRSDVIPRNPEVLLADILGPGFETNPLFHLTAPLANDIGALMLLSQGSDWTGADPNVDWMRQFFQQMMTPGGALPDLPQLWQNMVNAAAPGANPLTNAITAWTQVQDPTQQVQNVNSLIAAMADAGMHPLMAQAMLNAVGAAGVGWLGQFGQNPAAAGDSFTNYLAGRGFDFR